MIGLFMVVGVLVRVTRRVKMTVSSYLLNIVLILNLFLLTGCSLNEQCEKGDCAGSLEPPENKYSEAANSKFRHMEEELAKTASYEPCPQSNNCSCHLPTLIKDLQPFKHGITKQMVESVKKKGTKYQIIDNRLYRQKECLFPARCSGIEYFLLELVAGGGQYDTELIVNTRDWPQLNRVWGSPLAPVFSFSKTSDYWDIMYPAWSFWEGGPAIKLYPSGLGRWAQHRINIKKAAKEHPWDKKKPMAFFRGSRTSDERDPIVLLSRSRPDLVDAKYTKNQAWKSDADTLYQPPAEEVPLEDHCKFRYLFNYRGVAASFRFKHLFLCKSLVFHIGEDWLEFFYPSLIPWYHYIPVSPKATQEDIKTLIEYFREHDDVARRIAERGYQHISDNLRILDIKNYWKELLNQYSSLLNFQVERDMDLIEIVAKK